MDEGKILQWLKSEGDTVAKGDDLYEVETEKVNVEVESPADGTLLKVIAGDGETISIGTVIAWIGEPGEDVPDSSADSNGTPSPAASAGDSVGSATEKPEAPKAAKPQAPKVAAPAASASNSTDTRIKASPLARRMASEKNLDLNAIQGSGPDGRIVARDIAGAAQAGTAAAAMSAPSGTALPTPEGATRVELTSMRKTIARRLGEAWSAPSFILNRDVDMTAANALRASMLKRLKDGEIRPTVSDILTKAVAVALRAHPQMNAHWNEDSILQFEAAHVGLAVATDAGLVVPVIRDAHAKTVREIAADRTKLVGKARDGKLQPAEFEGGTFSISNLGMMGIDSFTAVLNPPQAGILAVGATVDTPVVRDRRVEIRPMMTISLTCDHRTVDGAVGARFLQTLVEHLEDPTSMI
jgi:pyruvate dehydrogenase E2 component (dihydrolipoamide acetyltransferase)